jgi:hypothetical protein
LQVAALASFKHRVRVDDPGSGAPHGGCRCGCKAAASSDLEPGRSCRRQ